MLIQFSVSNFRSIKEKVEISFVKSKGSELKLSNSFKSEAPNTPDLLKSAAVYGANAAGKSNVIKALEAMQEIIISSSSEGQVGKDLPVTPFLLDEYFSVEPSEFEVSFVRENVRYEYGFSATKDRVIEEWLIAYPKGSAQHWIDRVFDAENNKYVWGGMSSLTGKKQLWRDATRPNALFLSTAVQLNNKQLLPVFEWFSKNLQMIGFGTIGGGFTASVCKDSSMKDAVLEFLKTADVGIDDLKFEEKLFSKESLPSAMSESFRDELFEKLEGKTIMDIKTIHKSNSGNEVQFSLDQESDGTRKIFALSGPWLDVLQEGHVLVVDELHDNLHPHIVKYLVGLFHSVETNPKNAQLLFTTHDTSILNQEVLRRDQVWFCEKNSKNATELYPLTDFSPRKGVESLERGYLSGRYGALPYIKKGKLEAAC